MSLSLLHPLRRAAASATPSYSSAAYPFFLHFANSGGHHVCASCSSSFSPLRCKQPPLYFPSTSKRRLATSSSAAAAVASLETSAATLPPRNVGVGPSNAKDENGSLPRVNDVRPPPQPAAVVVQEQKAEKDVQEKVAKKPRPKLRPRKAAISLTPSAVSRLRSLLDQPSPKLIRVGVRNKGCSGLAYHLEYVDKPGMMDEVVNQDGVSVLVESRALLSVIGSEMDWVSERLGERFVFRNPNIKEQCGCGESFMV